MGCNVELDLRFVQSGWCAFHEIRRQRRWWLRITMSQKLCNIHPFHLWCKVLINKFQLSSPHPAAYLLFVNFIWNLSFSSNSCTIPFAWLQYLIIVTFITRSRRHKECQQHSQNVNKKKIQKWLGNTKINWNELTYCTVLHTDTHKCQQPNVLRLTGWIHYTFEFHCISTFRLFVCLLVYLFIQCLLFDCTWLTFLSTFLFSSLMRLIVICDIATNLYFRKNIFQDLFKMQINVEFSFGNWKFNKRFSSV